MVLRHLFFLLFGMPDHPTSTKNHQTASADWAGHVKNFSAQDVLDLESSRSEELTFYQMITVGERKVINVRTNGPDAKAELDSYVEEAKNDRARPRGLRQNELAEPNAVRNKLARLCEEVEDLSALLTTTRGRTDGALFAPAIDEHSRLGIAAAFMTSMVLGRLAQRHFWQRLASQRFS